MDIPAPRAPSDAATAATRRGGVLDAPVPEGRAHAREVPRAKARPRGEAIERTPLRSRPRKAAKRIKARAPVPQTDAGGPVEHTEAIGRTVAKELGKIAP